MQEVINITYVQMALLATLGTWFVTALGASSVIFFKEPKQKILNATLGFAAGVMIAASFWSLLQPAIERAEVSLKSPPWLVALAGFLCGAFFIWISDKIISHLQKQQQIKNNRENNDKIKRIIMLVFSITLHNIPEGLAVGVAFGAIASSASPKEALAGAISIAIGIGLQNFPEGAAVSIPLKAEGYSRKKSFFWGQLSGVVEPIAGVIGAVMVMQMELILPFALAFAAGAMVIVSVHELIPKSQEGNNKTPYVSTMGVILGFAIMMSLDVMLG